MPFGQLVIESVGTGHFVAMNAGSGRGDSQILKVRSRHLDGVRITDAAGSRATRLSMSIGVAACIAVVGWSSVAGRPLPAIPRPPYLAAYARPATIPYPHDNQYSAAREALGKRLFFDPMLSGSGVISCASCHNPALSWGDGRARAIGPRKNRWDAVHRPS
jgi:Di-haem cytochrome c peroxidase